MDGVERRSLLRFKPGVDWQHVDDDVVGLDLGSSAYLAVNTGAALWPLVAAGTTEHEVVQEFTARFGTDVDRAQADVGALIGPPHSMTLVEDG